MIVTVAPDSGSIVTVTCVSDDSPFHSHAPVDTDTEAALGHRPMLETSVQRAEPAAGVPSVHGSVGTAQIVTVFVPDGAVPLPLNDG